MPKFQLAKLLYVLPAFLIGVNYGLSGFCYAKLITVIIGFLLFLVISVRIIGITYGNIFYCLKVPFLAVAAMTLVVYLFRNMMLQFGVNQVVLQLIPLFSGCAVYLIVLVCLEKSIFGDLLKIGSQLLKSDRGKE